MRWCQPLFFAFWLISLTAGLSGCGGKPESAATPDQLDAYLQANPEIANEDAPEVEAE